MTLIYPDPPPSSTMELALSLSLRLLLPQSPIMSSKLPNAPFASSAPPQLRRPLGVLSPPLSPHVIHTSLATDSCDTAAVPAEITPIDLQAPSSDERAPTTFPKTFPTSDFHAKSLVIRPWKSCTIGIGYLKSHTRYLAQYSRVQPSQAKISRTPTSRLVRSNHKSYASSDTESELRPMGTRNRSSHPTPVPQVVEAKPPNKRRRVKETDPARVSTPSHSRAIEPVSSLIPDYSPPTSTLSHARCLKIEWKGQPMDLSNDPDFALLHPAEVALASTLRLPARMYLDSKKRFFYERVNCLKSGKQFRRTDAQKACRIDVNKASRLYAAFEKVGWLDEDLFKEFW